MRSDKYLPINLACNRAARRVEIRLPQAFEYFILFHWITLIFNLYAANLIKY